MFIVGQSPPRILKNLNSAGITVTGFVSDIRSQYLRSAVAVAPIRFGAGTLNKILEPMAMGIPVVATSVAKEGLPIEDGRDILVADSADAFAQSVVKLLRDDQLRRKLGASGQSIVREMYDWNKIAGQLEITYCELSGSHVSR